jgi:hypothetical protein
MSISNNCLRPSSTLPSVRHLHSASANRIRSALHSLQAIYCPLRLPPVLAKNNQGQSEHVDSGYASEDEVADENVPETGQILAVLRNDEFERNLTIRWLTGLISRADQLPFDEDEIANIIDEASFILSSFSDSTEEDAEDALARNFAFATSLSKDPITVRLSDAPLSGTDHTDVGLQSWGASIIFAGLLCSSPKRFGLSRLPSRANIIELGAGTGLVSLTLAKLVPLLHVAQPDITATDYHPQVLENLRANITTSFRPAAFSPIPVKTMLLDWSSPPASLESSADMLLAADAVYASEHAALLHDCAAHLLAPDGVFWLVVTLRSSGKFESIRNTTEVAFAGSNCSKMSNGRVLKILEKHMLEKQKGVGRDNESGYVLFKIGWVEC